MFIGFTFFCIAFLYSRLCNRSLVPTIGSLLTCGGSQAIRDDRSRGSSTHQGATCPPRLQLVVESHQLKSGFLNIGNSLKWLVFRG